MDGPALSKSKQGTLELNFYGTSGAEIQGAEIYLDGIFIGNATRDKPIIYARRGPRTVRIEAESYQTYEKTITILGDPNHQVLNIYLIKK